MMSIPFAPPLVLSLLMLCVMALPAFAGPPYEEVKHRSELLDSQETYVVMTPAGYDAPENAERRYPVVYGIQSRGKEFSRLKAMMERGVLEPIIVVGSDVDGGERAWSDIGRPTESYFIKELVPLIDREYRTQTEGPGRVLYGNSKGGSGALRLLLKYPEIFAASVSLDGAMQLYDEKEFQEKGEGFEQLIEKMTPEQKARPVLLVGGGWFGDRAAAYGEKLRGWGMRDVTLIQSPGCGHNSACLMEHNGVAAAVTWGNGLMAEGKEGAVLPTPQVLLGDRVTDAVRAMEPVRVTFRVPVHRAGLPREPEVFYTLDGTAVTQKSQRYDGPFEVAESSTLRVAAWGEGSTPGQRGRSREAFAQIEVLPMREAVEVGKVEPGLVLAWYQRGLPAESAAKGEAEAAGSRAVGVLPVKEEGLPDKSVYVLRSHVRVPETGIYRFDIKTDKASLAVGEGGEGVELGPTGAHWVALEAGLHPVAVVGEVRGGRVEVGALEWTPPGGERGEVPAEAVVRAVE